MRYTIFVAAGLTMALSGTLSAQGRLRPFKDGDGRIHAAPVLQVVERDLHPGEVQTVNLHPGYHTTLEFPYPVARVDAGFDKVFRAEAVGNKLFLKSIEPDITATSMTVLLGDADQTLVAFLVRSDSTQPMAFVVRYTDPVTKHLNEAERRIASNLSANVDQRVDELAEIRLQQRLLYSGGSIMINKRASGGSNGARISLLIEKAEQMPGPGQAPRLYIRYRLENESPTAVRDAKFVVRISAKRRKLLFFSRTTERQITAVEDIRTYSHVPPGSAVRGLLTMDGIVLKGNESLSIEVTAANGQRNARVDRVLVGSD